MAQIFAAFGKFSSNNKGSVQNFGIVGITIATEELTKFIFFFCPCSHSLNEVYGSTFIWGPASILLVVGYVVNRRTWRLTTGMCNRTQTVGRGCKRVIHFIFIFINITMKAVLAPATWVVVAFLKGDYYACAAWPGPNDPGVHEKFNLKPNTSIPPPCTFGVESTKPKVAADTSVTSEIIARDLRAYSHMVGWWFLVYSLVIGVFLMFCFRCMSKFSYEQGKYIDMYREKEMELFEEGLGAKAAAQAKKMVDQFLSKPRSKEEWDQIASINDKVMRSKRGRPIYSPMHKFANKELVALELAEDDIVADSAKKKHHIAIWKKKIAKPAAPKPGAAPPGPTNGSGTGRGGNAAPANVFAMAALSTTRGQTPRVQVLRQPVATNPSGPSVLDNKQANVAATPAPAHESLPQHMHTDSTQTGSKVDVQEDPIKESSLAEHPDIKKSRENLQVAESNVLEITEDGDQGAHSDSEPLI